MLESTMRLQKIVLRNGDGMTFPLPGDLIEVEYVLWLYQDGKIDGKGQE